MHNIFLRIPALPYAPAYAKSYICAMSALRIIELRSLNRVSIPHRQPYITSSRQLSRHSPWLLRPATTPHIESSITYRLQQRRYQSSSPNKKPDEQKPPPPSFPSILRALRQSFSFRPLFSAFRGQNLRTLFRQSPEELTIALVLFVIPSIILNA